MLGETMNHWPQEGATKTFVGPGPTMSHPHVLMMCVCPIESWNLQFFFCATVSATSIYGASENGVYSKKRHLNCKSRGTWWLTWWIIKFRSFPPNFQRYSEWVYSSFITISNLETPAAGDLATPGVSHWQELVPAARKFSCHVFVPLALTPGDSRTRALGCGMMWWGRTTAWE